MRPEREAFGTAARILLGPARRSAGSAEACRFRRLIHTVARAYDEVPFYKERFDVAGVKPSDIRTLDDLRRLPVVTKKDFRAAGSAGLVSRRFDPAGLLVSRTSGSTGIPLDILESKGENFVFHLVKFRALRSMGLRWRDRMINIRSTAHSRPLASWRILRRLGLLAQDTIEAGAPEKMAAALQGRKPDVVMGYTGTLVRVAQIIAGDPARAVRPRFLVGGSETMTPFFRSEIERGFGAPVFDTYISSETGLIAWECPAGRRYHVMDDSLIVEVLKGDAPCGPGEEGEVVVTSLISRAMPIIRYRLGDIVRIAEDECPCGRPGPTFERILGKTQDYFWLPDGREFNPWHLSGLWIGRAPWIRQFEVVQESPVSIVMRIVPSGPPPDAELAALSDQSRRILGTGVEFRVELVSEIESGPGGKLRYHRCLVRSIYDNPMDREWLKS